MAQKASTEKDVVRDITDVSLDDIHAAKKAAMQEIEGAIEKTPGIV